MTRIDLLLAVLLTLPAAPGCGRGEDAPRIRQVPGGTPSRGRVAFDRYGCGGCHVIPGVPRADGRVAPPLVDFADRAFVAGILPNEPEHLVRWIVEPDVVDPRTAMPNLGVTPEDARDMAAYLYTLRRPRR